ncbi:MAG: DEAD/DEAH box helicase [Myxococcota bacterium]|nr:DEAD/DEAH box helicase [Myxococcota bacterium]
MAQLPFEPELPGRLSPASPDRERESPEPAGSSRDIREFVEALAEDDELGSAIRHRRVLPAREPVWMPGQSDTPLRRAVLGARGIQELYEHQGRALTHLEAGQDVVLATPTASGKSLVYGLPTLEGACRATPERALFVFPLKALEQDQRAGLQADAAAVARALGGREARVAIYDGDTPTAERKRLRQKPPEVLITTPDMLHLGILPHHASWERFFEGLSLVVLDELHTYRGIFGSHVAQVLRRLERVARHHGSRPRIVCASATVANPGELAGQLAGREFQVVRADAAARATRHVLLLNPKASPYTAAARLFRLSVRRGLRTIAFTKARRVTELMHTWVSEADPEIAARISSYRAGFLPEERREIERRLFRGELLGVISTSALELGIDVGGLDVCILVGYPGSQISTWQRAGRVGRSGDALVALIAQPDALDQYLIAHPDKLFDGEFEHAVVDPENHDVRAAHLPCAAAEVPLRDGEAWLESEAARRALAKAEENGALLRSESGREWFAARRTPHRDVSLRAAGQSYAIRELRGDDRPRVVGSIGSANVFSECHEGAIYLHHGRQYRVVELDIDDHHVTVEPTRVPWFTRAQSEKETEILSRDRTRPIGNFRLVQGRVKVTTTITGYERRRVRGQDLLSTEPLDLPPSFFETTSVWLEMPDEIPRTLTAEEHHPMGSIHAIEHAALALFPLFALCDRFDVAGISTTRHPELGLAAVFFYDAHAGGVGLAPAVFSRIEALLEATHELISGCECDSGCPACVHSPRCGNGNRPIDKQGAVRALDLLLGREPLPELPPEPDLAKPVPKAAVAAAPEPRVVYFDLETQRSAKEVGGWHNAHLMRLALAVVWDSAEERFETFREADVESLVTCLSSADLVVGFNVNRFDYRVLRGYTERKLDTLPTFDLLDAIHQRLGFRLSLGHLGEETLGAGKSADGLQSLEWWKQGRVEEIERYCRQDVAVLRDLTRHAREHGHLIFRTKRGERVRLPMRYEPAELVEGLRARQAPLGLRG